MAKKQNAYLTKQENLRKVYSMASETVMKQFMLDRRSRYAIKTCCAVAGKAVRQAGSFAHWFFSALSEPNVQ